MQATILKTKKVRIDYLLNACQSKLPLNATFSIKPRRNFEAVRLWPKEVKKSAAEECVIEKDKLF